MKRHNRIIEFTAAVLIGTFVTQATALAQVEDDPKTNARRNRIVGIWDVDVVVGPCGGPKGPPFRAMHKYEVGGTGQVVPSSNPALLSAHLLVWEHVGGNQYRAAMKFYRYDNTGTLIGWNVITNEVMISEDGTAYAGSGVADFFNLNGELVLTVCPEFAGTRFSG